MGFSTATLGTGEDGLTSFIMGGGTVGGPNNTDEAQALRDQAMMYNATMMEVTDPRKVNNGDIYTANTSLTNPYATPEAKAVNWRQAPVTQAQVAKGQALQGKASTALGGQLNLGQSDQAREGQNALISSLQGTAAGQGPSVAQEQLRQTTAANVANQASAAQAAHGAARLAALRSSAANQAQIQQQANSQAAGLRAQEIQGAQSNLGNALGVTRSQDIGTAGQNAQLAQQTALFNAGNQQQMGLVNLGFGNQMALSNLQNQQGANTFNAGAANTSANNFAQQQNQGNLQLSQANLLAQQQANQLDLQRKQAYYDVSQRALDSQSDLYKTLYGGQVGYESWMRDNNKGLFGELGGMMGGGALGGLF